VETRTTDGTRIRNVTADFRALADRYGPEAILVADHPEGIGSAIIVVHNTARGPAMGGSAWLRTSACRRWWTWPAR